MPDAIFGEPRLAEIYDALDADRSDLDAYAAMADEFSAVTVLDVGCGTGTLACLLAATRRRKRGWSGTGSRPIAVSSSRESARSRRGPT